MREVVGFVPGLLGDVDKRRTEALVDQEPHSSFSSRKRNAGGRNDNLQLTAKLPGKSLDAVVTARIG